MNRPRRSRAAAFTTIELLFILGILGIAALAGGRLFEAVMRLGHRSAQAQNQVAAVESVLGALRADVWGAGEIVADGDAAELRVTDGPPITWISAGGTLQRRREGSPDRLWTIETDVAFEASETALVVRIGSTKHVHGAEFRLASQVRLLGRLRP